MSRNALVLLLLLTNIPPGWAEVVIVNPGIADHEVWTYTETTGALSRPFAVTVNLVGDPPRYEFRSVGVDLESVYRLDPVNLLSSSSEILTRAPDATVRKTAEYSNLKIKAGPEDLVVTDMGSLPMVFRGFPWGKTSFAKILYLGNTSYGGSAISFEVQVIGKEAVAAAGSTWDCWHATTGLGGPLSLFLAKTDWWFCVAGSHPLLKTSGPSGGPGSPVRTLLLQSYSTGKSPP